MAIYHRHGQRSAAEARQRCAVQVKPALLDPLPLTLNQFTKGLTVGFDGVLKGVLT